MISITIVKIIVITTTFLLILLSMTQSAGTVAEQNLLLLNKSIPHFFIIGSQKCSTSSIKDLLLQHPQFCRKLPFEHHYFTEFFNKGPSSYMSSFQKCGQSQYMVDKSPTYIDDPDAPRRMLETYGEDMLATKKFILVIREPVTRIHSEFRMTISICQRMVDGKPHSPGDWCSSVSSNCTMENYKQGCQFRTFQNWVNQSTAVVANSKRRGRYLEQIKNWLHFVKRDQLLIINYEDLNNANNLPKWLDRLSLFLSVPKTWPPNTMFKRIQVGQPNIPAPLECEAYEQLHEEYSEANKGLIQFINNDLNKHTTEPPFMAFSNTRGVCT